MFFFGENQPSIDQFENLRYHNQYPHEEQDHLEVVRLQAFVRKGTDLIRTAVQQADNGVRAAWEMIRYILAGRVYTGNEDAPFQKISITASTPDHQICPEEIEIWQDIDSMNAVVPIVGLTEDWPFSVYLLSNFKDTVTKSIHIETVITYRNQDISVGIHEVPNLCLGKFNLRDKINVMFPGLYNPGGSRAVSVSNMEKWYNLLLRPALLEVGEYGPTELPPDYASARANGQSIVNGQFTFGSVEVPGDRVEDLCRTLGRLAEEDEQCCDFRGLLFYIERRGVKERTRYLLPRDATEEEQLGLRLEAMRKMFLPFPEWVFEDHPPYFDVGMEYLHPEHTVRCLRSGHARLMQYVFPRMGDVLATATVGRQAYYYDSFAQLYEIAGARMDIRNKNPAFEGAQYYQIYFPELKTFSYRLGTKNIYAVRNAQVTLPNKEATFLGHLGKILSMLKVVVGNHQARQPDDPLPSALRGTTRMEVRVPYYLAADVMKGYPSDDVMRAALITFDPHLLWRLIWVRVWAIYATLDMVSQTNPMLRRDAKVAGLCAIMIYILNAVWRTENLDSWGRRLRNHSGRQRFAEADDALIHPESELIDEEESHGLYFLPDIAIRKAPNSPLVIYMNSAVLHRVGLDDIMKMFGYQSFSQYERHFPSDRDRRKARHPTRVRFMGNDGRTETVDEVHDAREVPVDNPPKGFDVERRVGLLPTRGPFPHDAGYAGRHTEMQSGAETLLGMLSLNQVLEKIWEQWVLDLFAMSSNRKSAETGNHLVLDPELRRYANDSWLKSLQLEGIFAYCRADVKGRKLWNDIYRHFFPDKQWEEPNHFQHYHQMEYFYLYRTLVRRLSQVDFDTIDTALKLEYDKLYWVPEATSTKVWNTRANGTVSSRVIPVSHKGPSPKIALNGTMSRDKISIKLITVGPTRPQFQLLLGDIREARDRHQTQANLDAQEAAPDDDEGEYEE